MKVTQNGNWSNGAADVVRVANQTATASNSELTYETVAQFNYDRKTMSMDHLDQNVEIIPLTNAAVANFVVTTYLDLDRQHLQSLPENDALELSGAQWSAWPIASPLVSPDNSAQVLAVLLRHKNPDEAKRRLFRFYGLVVTTATGPQRRRAATAYLIRDGEPGFFPQPLQKPPVAQAAHFQAQMRAIIDRCAEPVVDPEVRVWLEIPFGRKQELSDKERQKRHNRSMAGLVKHGSVTMWRTDEQINSVSVTTPTDDEVYIASILFGRSDACRAKRGGDPDVKANLMAAAGKTPPVVELSSTSGKENQWFGASRANASLQSLHQFYLVSPKKCPHPGNDRPRASFSARTRCTPRSPTVGAGSSPAATGTMAWWSSALTRTLTLTRHVPGWAYTCTSRMQRRSNVLCSAAATRRRSRCK